MIKIKTRYPWGEKYLSYDSWELIVYNNTENKIVKKQIFYSQEDYNMMQNTFKVIKETTQNIKEYTSHYFEFMHENIIFAVYLTGNLTN